VTDAKKYVPFFGCMISTKYPQFEASVRKTLGRLGAELVDLEGFTCCPDPIFFKSSNKLRWLTVAARNLCLAEEAGLDIITCCSGCTATFSEAWHLLHEDKELKKEVNKRLKTIGRQYKGTSRARHVVTVLRDDIGVERVRESVTKPLGGLKVAIHYGCHLLKPSRVMQVENPDHPQILERLLKAIGAEPLNHKEHLLCCGKACMNEEMPPRMTYDILKGIQTLGADCMGLICPTCFDEFDLGQIKLKRIFGRKFEVPVAYYFQLLGVAQGFTPEEMGLDRHKIDAKKMLQPVLSA
jgi:heterodisulfide reductase subunit B